MNNRKKNGHKLLRIPVLSDGTLCNISSMSNISDTHRISLNEIMLSIRAILVNRRYIVYLRGSLAYGGFITGISDIDMIIIVSEKIDGIEEQLAILASEYSRKFREWCSLVDISIYTNEEVLLPQNNRLYLNITLTGVALFIHGLKPNYPLPILNSELKERIIRQTLKDCYHTLDLICKHKPITYMGELRGADFLCVWFIRDFLRGTIAFVMEEQQCFSLHVQTCAILFSLQYPEYAKLTERLTKAECNPPGDWRLVESLANDAIEIYIALATKTVIQC